MVKRLFVTFEHQDTTYINYNIQGKFLIIYMLFVKLFSKNHIKPNAGATDYIEMVAHADKKMSSFLSRPGLRLAQCRFEVENKPK